MKANYVKFNHFEIHPDLGDNGVKYLWSVEATPNNGDYFIFRTYASIYPTLLFCSQGRVQPIGKEVNGQFLLLGQSNKWCRFRVGNDFKIFGITLYPFALPLLFGMPAHMITNKIHDSDGITPFAELHKFCQQVINSAGNLETVNKLLRDRITCIKNYEQEIVSLIRSAFSKESDQVRVFDDLYKTIFMSQRNFERKFKHYSGFTPKTFTNLIRLVNSLNDISFTQKKLSDTALEQSYFDQAHFSNEFKKHTGFQPKVFAKGSKEENVIWQNFVDFFQVLAICPPVLCKNE
jgi:AraC-like DNA-binding protein